MLYSKFGIILFPSFPRGRRKSLLRMGLQGLPQEGSGLLTHLRFLRFLQVSRRVVIPPPFSYPRRTKLVFYRLLGVHSPLCAPGVRVGQTTFLALPPFLTTTEIGSSGPPSPYSPLGPLPFYLPRGYLIFALLLSFGIQPDSPSLYFRFFFWYPTSGAAPLSPGSFLALFLDLTLIRFQDVPALPAVPPHPPVPRLPVSS